MADPTQTIRALYEGISNHQTAGLRDLFAPEVPAGFTAFETAVGELIAAFPDIRWTLEDIVASGDRVAVKFRWTGTHRGAFRGNPATGLEITNEGMAFYTLRDGRIAGFSLLTDRLGFLQQTRADARVIDPRKAPTGVYLIDTFTVPAAARADFEAAMLRNRAYIRSLDGFRGDATFVRTQGESFDIATIAAWESPAAISRAKDLVAAHYTQIGFDPAAALTRWGVTLQRTICEAPAQLQ